MMSMDIDGRSPLPTAKSPADTLKRPNTLSATYASIFNRPELYTRPQYLALREQSSTPAPLRRSDTASTTHSCSSAVASPDPSWNGDSQERDAVDGVVDNVARFLSRSHLAEPSQEGLWAMDDDNVESPYLSPESLLSEHKSPEPFLETSPVPTRSLLSALDTPTTKSTTNKRPTLTRKKSKIEDNGNTITQYFSKVPIGSSPHQPLVAQALTSKHVNTLSNVPRRQTNKNGNLDFAITKTTVVRQKRKSNDLCSTPAMPAGDNKVIKVSARTITVTATAGGRTTSTSATTVATERKIPTLKNNIASSAATSANMQNDGRPNLARMMSTETMSTWQRNITASSARAQPRPYPLARSQTSEMSNPRKAQVQAIERVSLELCTDDSDEDDEEDDALCDASPTRSRRSCYTRSSTVPIINVCSPPTLNKFPASAQDDSHITVKTHPTHMRTPSPARTRGRSNLSRPIDMPDRKGRLMRPVPMALIKGTDMAASPDSVQLLAALNCGYSAAAFKQPDRNPFL
ncbi:hypothetical protein DFJ77DRAFT_148132 [Powellomyces hirtus]|nr:hypothetical protein DFJ77DRAFT_148132 [Powellomyces hirtus]